MPLQRIDHSRRSGFTLVELVLVVAIIAILGAIASPRYVRSISHYRASCAANRIAVDLSWARSLARTSSASRTVSFSIDSHSYRIHSTADIERASRDHLVVLAAEPYSSQIVSVDFAGDTTVVFNGWGVPDRGGTIVVRSGDAIRMVRLDAATGRVSVQ